MADKSDQSSSEGSESEEESVAVDSVFNRGDINAPEESDHDSDEEVRKIPHLLICMSKPVELTKIYFNDHLITVESKFANLPTYDICFAPFC